MKIVILGSTGMLGNAVRKHMEAGYGEENIFCSTRGKSDSSAANGPNGGNDFFFDAAYTLTDPRYINFIPRQNCDYVINCIGIIKPHMEKNLLNSIFLNALFPHMLADYCKQYGLRLIHITTDCVYSGKDGKYTETDPQDALDEYGKSKSLGEVTENAMTIRTSIIGPEIDGRATSLVELTKANKGLPFNAFTNWYWNGVTTKQYAKICQQIIEKDLWEPGLFHIFSDTIVKGDLIKILNEKYNLELKITDCEAPYFCDRTLETVNDLINKLDIPPIREQIEEM